MSRVDRRRRERQKLKELLDQYPEPDILVWSCLLLYTLTVFFINQYNFWIFGCLSLGVKCFEVYYKKQISKEISGDASDKPDKNNKRAPKSNKPKSTPEPSCITSKNSSTDKMDDGDDDNNNKEAPMIENFVKSKVLCDNPGTTF